MNAMKSLAAAALLGLALPIVSIAVAQTTDKPATSETTKSDTTKSDTTKSDTTKSDTTKSDDKKFTKAQIEAFFTKCSQDADAKGLKGPSKRAERKEFRRACLRKFGVSPKD